MSQKANNAKLGLFVISGTVLAVLLLVLFGAGSFLEKKVIFETYFDSSVQGLDIGSPVKFRGVQIGKVTEITFVQTYYPEVQGRERQDILVRMEVTGTEGVAMQADQHEERIEKFVQSGMRLRLASQGITGLSYIQADYLDPDSVPPPPELAWEPSELYIPSAPNQIAAIADSVEAIVRDIQNADVKKIASNIDRLLVASSGQIEDLDIQTLSRDIRTGIDTLNSTLATIEKYLVSDDFDDLKTDVPEAIASIRATAENLNKTVENLGPDLEKTLEETYLIIADVRERLEGQQMQRLPELIDEVYNAFVTLADDLSGLARESQSIMAENRNELNATLENVQQASQHMKHMSETLRDYPSFGLMGDPPSQVEIYE